MHLSVLLRRNETHSRPASLFLAQRFIVFCLIALAFMTFTFAARAQSYNTAYGESALEAITTGSFNSAFGSVALRNNRSGSNNTAVGYAALNGNFTGSANTAVGAYALDFNNTSDNTGVGYFALYGNRDGTQNTAVGIRALRGVFENINASYNTAIGFESLRNIYTGGGNVATGWQAMYSNSSGEYNTAIGVSALRQNTTGKRNTAAGLNSLYYNDGQNNAAYGAESLQNNSTGNNNTAVGFDALFYNNTGSNNVALGYQAGLNLSGSNNIIIGASVVGAPGDANKIRIGKTTHTATYIAGIYNKTVASATGVAVKIDSTGKLGTVLSSARYKEAIKPMDMASEAILQLEPVTFRYKQELDPDGVTQFGLIAEQVEKIDPDLVVRDEDGKVSTVRYEAVNAMLLNEFLKAHRKLQEQGETLQKQQATIAKQEQKIAQQQTDFQTRIAQQQKQIDALAEGLQKVSEQAALSRLPARLVSNRP